MKKIIVLGLALALSIPVLTSCEQGDGASIFGGVVGAAVGSRFGKGRGRIAGMVLGAVVGSMIARKLSRHMRRDDHKRTARVFENNKNGQSTKWRNPDTGYEYTATPKRTYYNEGRPCREFTMDANIGGKMEQVYGTACRQPDGSWKIIK